MLTLIHAPVLYCVELDGVGMEVDGEEGGSRRTWDSGINYGLVW